MAATGLFVTHVNPLNFATIDILCGQIHCVADNTVATLDARRLQGLDNDLGYPLTHFQIFVCLRDWRDAPSRLGPIGNESGGCFVDRDQLVDGDIVPVGIDTLSCFACQEAQSSNVRHMKIIGLREPATEQWAKFHRY